LEGMGDPAAYYWIDIREEAHPPLFLSHEHRPWYTYDQWDLPSDRPIVLVCETGIQSRTIAYALRRKHRRSDIYSFRGGIRKLLSG
jgi:rhodanese-related sulfurtransferase